MLEKSIICKIKSGDIEVLKLVYELFYKSTFQAAFFVTRDTGLAEDVVHEVFLKINQKINQLEDPSKLGSWLCRISMNTARDLIRKRSKITLYEDARNAYNEQQLDSPEYALLVKEEQQIIKYYIQKLNPKYRRVIYLKYFEGFTVKEISVILELPIGTVKTHLFQARSEINKLLTSNNMPALYDKNLRKK